MVILSGYCTISTDDQEWRGIGGRESVFEGLPYALYLPPGTNPKDAAFALYARHADKDLVVRNLAYAGDEIELSKRLRSKDFGTPDQQPVLRATPGGLRALDFPAGSMGPKVDAACRFVERGGSRSVITDLAPLTDAINGGGGTVVVPSPDPT